MIRRRKFIAGIGGIAVASPLGALAQQAERERRVSFLYPFPEGPRYYAPRVAALRERLAELGWIEGRNLKIDLYPGPQEQISDRAAELVRSAPDVIVVFAVPATRAVQQQTRTIPIVAVALGDPVAGGLVKSMARPEGNVTGFTNALPSFGGKWVQLLKAVAPQMSRIAMVSDISLAVPGQIYGLIPPIEAAAKAMGIEAVRIAARTPAEAAVAIRAFAEQPNGGLAVVPPMGTLEGPVISLAAEHKLPSVGLTRVEADIGTLLSYGADNILVFRDAATYVDRILRGAKVGDLPVQFATKFELIVNLKTAKTIGLEVPRALLALADDVIE
jgi:putative tryptophan/tyrosine transport system substrate-binding protein